MQNGKSFSEHYTIFYDEAPLPLIQGKSVMARVLVATPDVLDANDSTPVAVKGRFQSSSGGDTLELVGCFRVSEIKEIRDEGDEIEDTDKSIYLNLFQKAGSQNVIPGANGNLSIEVNPLGSVTGFPEGAGCGPTSVAEVAEASRSDNAKSMQYNVKISPHLNVDFVRVDPPCDGSCSYGKVENLTNFMDKEMALVKAMYPIAPGNVAYETRADWFAIGDGSIDADRRKKLEEACPVSAPTAECWWTFAVISDLTTVRELALSAKRDILPNRRFVGVVPKGQNGGLSYFRYLFNKFQVHGATKGIHTHQVPDAVLAQEDFWVAVPHELGHSFMLRYPANNIDDLHQRVDIATSGYWIDLLNFGLRIGKNSFMEAELSEIFPPQEHWIDTSTFSQLYTNLSTGDRFQIKQIAGDEIYVSGFVTKSGKFILSRVLDGVQAGLAVGDTENTVRFQSRDKFGSIVSQVKIPLDFHMTLEGENEPQVDVPLSAVSTGVPFQPNALSVNADVVNPRGVRIGQPYTFFPVVETLRTALDSVPPAGFAGNAEQTYSTLNGTLQSVESLLKNGRVEDAKNKIAGTFRAQVLALTRDGFERTSYFQRGQSELLAASRTAVSNLRAVIESNPPLENGLIRVSVASVNVGAGERGQFSIFAATAPANPEVEFALGAILDGAKQRVEGEASAGWSFATSRLAAGTHDVSLQLYQQDKRSARAFIGGIRVLEEKIFELSKRLKQESDPEKIAEIQAEIDRLSTQITALESQLDAVRLAIGTPIAVTLTAQ